MRKISLLMMLLFFTTVSLLHTIYAETKIPEGFVLIKGGPFIMGSPDSESERGDDEAQHRVTVSSFYMSKYQVTQSDYEGVMDVNPSNFKGYNFPVENVSWYDAIEYCNNRSIKEGLTPAYTVDGNDVTWNRSANGYRLPTEAEWEYACRAGAESPFSTGKNITTNQANYDGNYPYNNNATGTYRDKTTKVGNFAPNPWGLHDMHGNVWEWVWDWYLSTYYGESGNTEDPVGASTGAVRVIRGGSWSLGASYLRSALRSYIGPSGWVSDIGFRVLRP